MFVPLPRVETTTITSKPIDEPKITKSLGLSFLFWVHNDKAIPRPMTAEYSMVDNSNATER